MGEPEIRAVFIEAKEILWKNNPLTLVHVY